jgi:hypothetical protein
VISEQGDIGTGLPALLTQHPVTAFASTDDDG